MYAFARFKRSMCNFIEFIDIDRGSRLKDAISRFNESERRSVIPLDSDRFEWNRISRWLFTIVINTRGTNVS